MAYSLIPIIVIFCLSLIGSFILFKFLKSSATIKKPTYRAGGAIAGFIIIYVLLFGTFKSVYKPSEKWTIIGTVIKEDASLHDGITVKQIPPSPDATTDNLGAFTLDNVKVIPGEGWPELYFECKGFHPRRLLINKENIKSLHKGKREIRLKDNEDSIIELQKIPESDGGEWICV